MPYDEDVANRLRELLADRDVDERRMFGGLCFLVGGHMTVAASRGGGILTRVAREDTDAMLARDHVSRPAMGGRQMTGWVSVAPEGARTKRQLSGWVTRALAVVDGLPPKR